MRRRARVPHQVDHDAIVSVLSRLQDRNGRRSRCCCALRVRRRLSLRFRTLQPLARVATGGGGEGDAVGARSIHDDEIMVVTAQNARKAEPTPRERHVIVKDLVSQRDHNIGAATARGRARGGCGGRGGGVEDGRDASGVAFEGAFAVQRRVLSAALKQPDERDAPAAPRDLHDEMWRALFGVRQVVGDGGHVGVEPHAVELFDAMEQRLERNVRLVIAKAEHVHRKRVQRRNHAPTLVDGREQRWRKEVSTKRGDEFGVGLVRNLSGQRIDG